MWLFANPCKFDVISWKLCASHLLSRDGLVQNTESQPHHADQLADIFS